MKCPYCENEAIAVDGFAIYPDCPDLYNRKYWQCEPCGAYVGCKVDTLEPFGKIANVALRHAKIEAHGAFDNIWKAYYEYVHSVDDEYEKSAAKKAYYNMLAKHMGITIAKCDINWFDLDQCRQVINLCEAGLFDDG